MTEIVIIGSGNMARGIGTRAIAAGRSVQILGQDLDKAAALAAELGTSVTSGPVDFTAIEGDIVVLAVPYDAARALVAGYGAALADKAVIDITNPIDFSTFDALTVAAGTSAAEELAELAAPVSASSKRSTPRSPARWSPVPSTASRSTCSSPPTPTRPRLPSLPWSPTTSP